MNRLCRWCEGPIPARARADSKYCGTPCRQAAHRAKVDRLELATTAEPKRLAYADPPYLGLAERYYGDHRDYAGEVDHRALIEHLATFDGWALSASSASVLAIAEILIRLEIPARPAVWTRRPAPHPTARIVTAYEFVWFVPARSGSRGSGERLLTDVLVGVDSRQRPTLVGHQTGRSSVIGMKPPAMLEWTFGLLGAMPGDSLADLFPGSGMVARAWADYTGEPLLPPGSLWEPLAAAEGNG